jgi:hypothetical protein
VPFDGHGDVVRAHVATDVRFNRRDSIVLQGQTILWSSVDAPKFAKRALPDHDGAVAIRDAYAASIAWQFSWQNVDLRAGIGISTIPGAWLMDTVDLSYRFGGSTRVAERKLLRGDRSSRPETANATARPGGPVAAEVPATPAGAPSSARPAAAPPIGTPVAETPAATPVAG